jgi:ATP-dependent protease ClpP protease subunit
VKLAINRLTEWDRLYPKEPIQIVFTSGGGSVVDGMALFDFILGLRKAGHRVTTSTLGMAASMAGILLQAGDVRTMGKEAWLMIHEASFRTEGKIGEVEDTVEWIKKVQERVLDIFASRSIMPRAEIKEKWLRRDWWIDSDSALQHGFVDSIR